MPDENPAVDRPRPPRIPNVGVGRSWAEIQKNIEDDGGKVEPADPKKTRAERRHR